MIPLPIRIEIRYNRVFLNGVGFRNVGDVIDVLNDHRFWVIESLQKNINLWWYTTDYIMECLRTFLYQEGFLWSKF